MQVCNLTDKNCKPCEGGVPPMTQEEIDAGLKEVTGWLQHENKILKTWEFKNHYEAMAFVNAVAFVSHKEDHHPYITVGWNDVRIEYWTHAIGGLSENDFICAAKVDLLVPAS